MTGKKGRSGRKKDSKSIVQYMSSEIDANWTTLVAKLIEKASNGDKEALFYCFDRRIGKPKVYEVHEFEGIEALGAGAIQELFKLMDRRRELVDQKLIEGPNIEQTENEE